MVVPLLPQKRSAVELGMTPARPVRETVLEARSIWGAKPSVVRQSSMTWVSSAKRTLERVQGPSARAARTNARLVRLLEPGGVILARKGAVKGGMERSVMETGE